MPLEHTPKVGFVKPRTINSKTWKIRSGSQDCAALEQMALWSIIPSSECYQQQFLELPKTWKIRSGAQTGAADGALVNYPPLLPSTSTFQTTHSLSRAVHLHQGALVQ